MSLEKLRSKIDGLDEEIVRLLSERAATAIEIGKTKVLSNCPLQNEERERAVLKRVKSLNDGPLDDDSLESIYRDIIDACTRVQENTAVVRPDEC